MRFDFVRHDALPRLAWCARIENGYDSTAVSALASSLGCREAVTFRNRPGTGFPDDHGTAVGDLLGLKTTEYYFLGFKELPVLPEAEFCASPHGTDVVMAVMEEQPREALLFTGRHGDIIWGNRKAELHSDLREPSSTSLSGTTMNEFRLRAGFFHFAVPFVGAVHARSIYGITTAEEMKLWSVAGEYDRPIPRRIAEEAGVPRSMLGCKKQAGAYHWLACEGGLSAALDFSGRLSSLLPVPLRVLRILHKRYRRPPGKHEFLFQWGFHRIKHRYECAQESPPARSYE
jgi:hypothetical protein